MYLVDKLTLAVDCQAAAACQAICMTAAWTIHQVHVSIYIYLHIPRYFFRFACRLRVQNMGARF